MHPCDRMTWELSNDGVKIVYPVSAGRWNTTHAYWPDNPVSRERFAAGGVAPVANTILERFRGNFASDEAATIG